MDKHAFLFGSGLSISAGIPSLADITNQILSGDGVSRHTDGTYLIGGHSNPGDATSDYVPPVLHFIQLIDREISEFYKHSEYTTNYEVIYYVISQISDSGYGEYENPIIKPFVDKLIPELNPFLGKSSDIPRKFSVEELSRESCNYIEHIVWHMLEKRAGNIDYLDFLKDSSLDPDIEKYDIYTLNHDTIVEQYLSSAQIEILDGFGKPQNDVRYLDMDLFEDSGSKIRLLKLHGSINWFRFNSRSQSISRDEIGIPLGRDLWHTLDPEGVMQWPADGSPLFLAGVFNKILNYSSGIYADLHYLFHSSLRDVRNLVVCGYSWGDKGINSRVINWLYKNEDNKIILIHPRPESCKMKSRGAISNKWDSWIKGDRLRIIPKGAEEITWAEIKDNIAR